MNRLGKSKKVFVGLSGGVDSSVAAFLLQKEGYDVTGVFMKCFNVDGCAERDAEDARRVADHLHIPFYVFDFEEEYKREVVEYMVQGYREGITPNPDVMCNKHIKFGLFLKKALALGADYIATGHYVRKVDGALYAAKDDNKDQSYFLWTLTKEQIDRSLFPIGDYIKPEVRKIAREAGLPTAEKKDSQGICFLGKVSIQDFLKQYIPEHEGALVAANGEVVGHHEGAEFYTIGQRRLGIKFQPIMQGGETKPHYVVGKDIKTNTVHVVPENDPALFMHEVMLQEINIPRGEYEGEVYARVRYRQPLSKATIMRTKEGIKLTFSDPQKFVARGQSAVFYSKDGEMLGGGVIF